jgi:hypothetical protein
MGFGVRSGSVKENDGTRLVAKLIMIMIMIMALIVMVGIEVELKHMDRFRE